MMSGLEELHTSEPTTVAAGGRDDSSDRDSSGSQTVKTNPEVPSWIINKLRTSKYCTYCQQFMNGWTGLLNGDHFNDLDVVKYPYHKIFQACKQR